MSEHNKYQFFNIYYVVFNNNLKRTGLKAAILTAVISVIGTVVYYYTLASRRVTHFVSLFYS